MTEIVAAHLERVARELAAKIKAEHRCDEPTCWLDVQDENCLAGVLAAALAACAREERLDEAIDWRDAAVSLTRSAHEKWMESRLAELRVLERAAGEKG